MRTQSPNQVPNTSALVTPTLKTKPLFNMRVTLRDPLNIGISYAGHRIIYDVESGIVQGDKVCGRLKPSGGDWVLRHPDGTFTLDVKVCIETHDGALIFLNWRGRLVIPENIAAKVVSKDTCDGIDKDEYYFRNLIMIETSSERYQWLNNIVAISQGQLIPEGIQYYVMEVL